MQTCMWGFGMMEIWLFWRLRLNTRADFPLNAQHRKKILQQLHLILLSFGKKSSKKPDKLGLVLTFQDKIQELHFFFYINKVQKQQF